MIDQMDIDPIVDVPDTPDRLAKHGVDGRNGVRTENQRLSLPLQGWKTFPEEGSRDQPMIIDSGSPGLSLYPPKRPSSPNNSRCPPTSAPSPKNANLFRKGIMEKKPNHLTHDSMHKHLEFVRTSYPSKSSSSSHRPARGNASSSAVPGNSQADFQRRSVLPNGALFSQEPSSFVNASCNGNEGTTNASRCDLSIAFGDKKQPGPSIDPIAPPSAKQKRLVKNGCISPYNIAKDGNEGTTNASRCDLSIAFGDKKKPGPSIDPIAPPRPKLKRLVKNGCISPYNQAKAKQSVGKDINSSVAVAHNNGTMASNAPPVSTNIRELVDEEIDSHMRKGKGVISQSYLSRRQDRDAKILHGSIGRELVDEEIDSHMRKGKGVISNSYLSRRQDRDAKILHGSISSSFTSSSEKAVDTTDCNIGAGKGIEESSSWRTTHNRNRETISILSPDKEHHSLRERVTPNISVQHHEKKLDRRGKGINVANGDDYFEDPSLISSEHLRGQSLKKSVSQPKAPLGRPNRPRSAADTLIKRQKQGSDLSSYAECSTSVSDDLEVILLSSPAEAANSRSTTSNVNNRPQIIEVDESSPQLRCDTHNEEVRARQLEADELLARELQEQFYNETPVFGVEQADLQRQDGPSHGSSRGRQQQVLDASLTANLHRQSQPRSSSNAPRRGYLARASTLGRMTRLRNRFPGQPRSLSSSRGRNSIFPPDMDVDMRMHILGALEEFNDMGMSAGILHANRDFNENDYEMLLALDDNNNHGGASDRQINGLPQSTVQSDYDEACAICLDTPTVGDTIRHLPCLHKFHKDCIDPWLRRKTSCPVCKSSITS